MYAQLVPFGAGGTATPEQMQARIETSARAFTERFWRADLAHWDEVVKPGAVAAHRAAAGGRSRPRCPDDELAEHVERCRDHLEAMFELHHRYSAPSLMATGDFLAGALEWTGATAGELMGLLRGTSADLHRVRRRRAGRAGRRGRRVRRRRDGPGVIGDAEAVLSALTADADAGPAARAYLDAVRYRSIGYDVGEPSAGELPAMLVGAIRAAVASRKPRPGNARGRRADRDPRARARRAPRRVRRPPARGAAGQPAPGRAGRVLRRMGRRPRPPRPARGRPPARRRGAPSPTRHTPSTRTPPSSRRCCAASRARARRTVAERVPAADRRAPSTTHRRCSGRRRRRRRRWRRSRSRPGAPRSP